MHNNPVISTLIDDKSCTRLVYYCDHEYR